MLEKEGEFMKSECTAEWEKDSKPEQSGVGWGAGYIKPDSPTAPQPNSPVSQRTGMTPGVLYKQRLWGVFHHTGSPAHDLPASCNYT